MDLLGAFSGVVGLFKLALAVIEMVAFVDAARHPASAYPAADKGNKASWLVVLGVAVVVTVAFQAGLSFIGLIGLIAVIVYLVDVRPQLKAVGRGGSSGPYGPW